MKKIVLQLIALLFFNFVDAQQINFTTLNTNDGLSSNTVNAILKDRYGLMWFATDDGLNKFDGTNFTVYRNHANDPFSLQSNEITALHEDKKGNLWIGTSGGAFSRYNRTQDNFINFARNEAAASILGKVVLSLASDDNGKLWIGHYTGVNIFDPQKKHLTVFRYNKGTAFTKPTEYLFNDSKSRMWIGTTSGLIMFDPATAKIQTYLQEKAGTAGLTSTEVRTIAEDRQGRIWIGTNSGLRVKLPGTDSFYNYQPNVTAASEGDLGLVNAIAFDASGKLWAGTSDGIAIIDPVTRTADNIAFNPQNVQGLTGRSINSIYMDEKGIFWVGTFRGGIDKYDHNLSIFNLIKSNAFDKNALPAPIVTSFAELANNQIYVGTENGGIALFDKTSKTFSRLNVYSKTKAQGDGLIVLALKAVGNKKLIAGTFADGLIAIDLATGSYVQKLCGPGSRDLPLNDFFALAQDRSGNIWAGTNGEGIIVLNDKLEVIKRYMRRPKFSTDHKLPINGYIRDIVQDRSGNMWIATHGGGLAVLNPATDDLKVYSNANSGLPVDNIQSILEDRKGNIWVGSFGGGLGLFDPKNGRFKTYAEQQGLLNNIVYKILEDADGKLWLSTNQGLSSFDPVSGKFNNYTYHNGLQHNNFVHGAGLRSSEGTLFFGGMEGFNYFKPGQLNKNKYVPEIIFTELKVANQPVAPSKKGPINENISFAKEINLDYKQNFVLSFVGLNYTASEQNQYAYKLEGFDKTWNNVGHANSAAYTNLDPGDYTFKVRAANNDGVWNRAGKSIKITVHPPFWRTNIAYTFYVCFIVALMLYFRHQSIKKVKRKFRAEQEKMLIDQERRETERTRELDRLKIKFLTNLSHEFRTPISLILGPIDTLMRQKNNEHAFAQLHMIKRNGRRLLNLVNQLLDFRKMEENELRLHPSEGEFVSFVKEATDSFRDLAERKKIELVFDNHIASRHALFDHDKMERILFNLLSNAFKFTLEGGRVTVLIDDMAKRTDDTVNWTCIKIMDTGIGIAQDKLEKVFDNFYQDATAPEILNQGSGIGLSITREFVKMLGGTIGVESELSCGTTFTLAIPLQQIIPALEDDSNTELSTGSTTAVLPSGALVNTGVREDVQIDEACVLLIEDNDDYRYYLKDSLRSNYKVLEASNGKEGWQKVLAQHPQLVVSDISMPYMDGIELCKKIKADKRTNHIPVILLTALTGEQNQLRGLETGANDYITKPFNCELLNAKVKNLLALNNNLKNTYTKQIKVLMPAVEIESDNERLMSTIMSFLEENLTDTQLSVEVLSKHVGMSRSSLYSKLLELTGQTPVEFIRSIKLEKAAVLLEKSDMNMGQIAYTVGFATPNYFAKSFKAKFNLLPSEYAQKMRKDRKE